MKVARHRFRIALATVALATAGGLTASIAQGVDPPSTASFRTVDGIDMFQRTAGSGTTTSASIVTGGTVTFTSSATEQHNVDFDPPAQGGLSCQQTTGGTSPSALRFPGTPTAGSWAGVCTFTRAGTYSFMCDMHPGMTGTVVVSDPGTAPGTTPTTATTPTTTSPGQTTASGTTGTSTSPTETTAIPPAPPPAAPTGMSGGPAPVAVTRALSVELAVAQRGARVRGTISGAAASARVTIRLTARRRDLGLPGRVTTAVGIGSLSARTTARGVLAFAVELAGRARARITTRGRLPVTVLVTAPSATGAASVRTFRVVVRPAGS